MDARQLAFIGTRWVGSSVAISTLHSGVADELLLHDVREAVAEGEAMDLAHGASFYPPAVVRAAMIEEMVDADVVVIAAGRGGRPGESRLEFHVRDQIHAALRQTQVRYRKALECTHPRDRVGRRGGSRG
jgi:malate/lactate dehydrogenase